MELYKISKKIVVYAAIIIILIIINIVIGLDNTLYSNTILKVTKITEIKEKKM
jgi:hypothetical protein